MRDDQVTNGQFTILSENVQKTLRSMIEQIATENHAHGTLEQKIAGLYHLVSDQDRCNREGISPIKGLIEEASSLGTMHDYQELCSRLYHHGANAFPFGIGCGPDLRDSNMNIVIVGQGGYSLIRDYYLKDDADSKEVFNAYLTYIVDLLTAAGYDLPTAEHMRDDIIDLERRMAAVAYPLEKLRDVDACYHRTTWQELQRRYPHIEWETLRIHIHFPEFTDVNLEHPEPLAEADRLLADTPLEKLKSRLLYIIISGASGCLGQKFRDINFKFRSATSGIKEDIPLWKRAVNVVKNTLPDAVGRMFVERYFPESNKQRVTAMVERMREAFAKRIEHNGWMSEETRLKALEKLKAMKLKIGYPADGDWDDYDEVEVNERLSYFENIWNITAYEADEFIRRTVNKPVDKKLWDMEPYAVNACYNLVNNDITFPAGILQPPFFDEKEDDAYNYGAIGCIIGHEMTHGFDDQGHKFDKDGNRHSWWTEADEERFKAHAKVLEEYFDGKEVIPGAKVNGKQTLGENLGDNGGVNIAWDALQLSMAHLPLPDKSGKTPAQRFFIAFAHDYAGSIRPETEKVVVKSDVHSPASLRVNGTVAHIDSWYDAFNITPEDKLYVAPEARARVW